MNHRVFTAVTLLLFLPGAVWTGTWQLKQDELKTALTYGHWETDQKFASSEDTSLSFGNEKTKLGESIDFDPDIPSKLVVNRLHVGLGYGITDKWQLGLALPLILVDFDTSPTDLVDSNAGLGDLVTTTQYRLFSGYGIVAATRLQWKTPTAGFDPSSYRIPLGEGQHDFLYWLAFTVYPPIGYLNIDVAYKQRLTNPTNDRDYGDEVLAAIEYGYGFEFNLGLGARLEILNGQEGEANRFGNETLPRRRLYALAIQTYYKINKAHSLNAGFRYLMAGEDYPTGIQFSFGYAATIGSFFGRDQAKSSVGND